MPATHFIQDFKSLQGDLHLLESLDELSLRIEGTLLYVVGRKANRNVYTGCWTTHV